MKTSSIAVETSRSTTLSDSIVRQTNKRSSYLSYTTMYDKHIFNDIFLFVSAQIPGFMVMQVRYLYEAEGNKKAKDAKAVSSKCA